MNAEEYQPTLDVSQLLRELQRLLLGQRRSERLICRYLADLADGVVEWPTLTLAYGTPLEFIRATFGLSAKTARERIRIGRALRSLPVLDAALTVGQIAYSGVREVTRVATPDTERTWLDAAQRLSPHALERRVAAAGGGKKQARRRPRRQTEQASEPGHVNVSVPSEVWALVLRAIHAIRAARGSELDNWQALAEVARSAIAHAESHHTDGGHAESVNAGSGHADGSHADSSHADSSHADSSHAVGSHANKELSADGPSVRDGRPAGDWRSAPHGGSRDSEVSSIRSVIHEHQPTSDKDEAMVLQEGSRVSTASGHVNATSSSPNYAVALAENPTELAGQSAAAATQELPVPHSGACAPPSVGHGGPAAHGGRPGHGDQRGHDGRPGHGDQPAHGERPGHGDQRGLGVAAGTASPTVNASDGGDAARGSVPCRSDGRGKQLSADAQLLYDLIATGGDWNLATLEVVTEMPHSRLAEAVVDLELSRMIRRDVMGFFEVTVNQAG